MWHPANLDAWKMFDSMHLQFSYEPRNVRLGLVEDGFNPFGMLRIVIDVYLQPLVEELRELWDVGVEAYDASSKNVFQLRAALMWTIHDFPAYANVLSWSTKVASNIIMDTESFVGRCLGKKCQEKYNERKREKNVMDNILGMMLNLKDRTKDNYKAHLDLADIGIRSELHLRRKGDDKYMILPACFHMTALEKDGFLQVLWDVRVLDGYASNISCRVNLKERKISISYIASAAADIVVTLCESKKIFPPSFFTVMVHLVMHLATEAKIGSPFQYCWMYPIETMHKGLMEDELRRDHCRSFTAIIHKHHMEKFCGWFRSHVMSMTDANSESTGLTDTLITFFKGPYTSINWLKHYIINGLKFRSSNVEANRKMQNSRVSVATEGGITYYGVLIDIIELNYSGNIRHVLFKCTWVDDQNRRGYKTDELGFPMVNFTHSIHGRKEMVHEPYVLAFKLHKFFMLKIKGTKIGMSSLKRKSEMCLMWGRDDVKGMTTDASIIGPRDLHEMDNLDDYEFNDDEFNDEDDNEVEYNNYE
ncbi:uncharacterized protein LOC136067129 [Quercus suber]|uniref:uncharacterized protein LOC136067129 n=1 Tax=Quercus suber TaxID=58331 RepID=UPI0032DE916B